MWVCDYKTRLVLIQAWEDFRWFELTLQIWACGKFELDSKEKDVLRQIQEFLCIREIFTSSDPRSAVILHHKQQNFFFEESPY